MILCEFNCNCDVYVILVSVLLFDYSFGKMVTIKITIAIESTLALSSTQTPPANGRFIWHIFCLTKIKRRSGDKALALIKFGLLVRPLSLSGRRMKWASTEKTIENEELQTMNKEI